VILLSGIAWLFSSMNVIFKDIGHAVQLATNMLFWVTPIIWPYEKLTGNLKYIALLNPFFYIIEGYRFTFIKKTWFFTYAEMNVYFWGVTLFILLLGILTFRKLRKEFGDYL
jgi:ABC-type polysaccharide/polyol phosphate export permease